MSATEQQPSVAEVLRAPDRFQVVMGAAGVRLWSVDRELPEWAKDDVVTEYVRAEVAENLAKALQQIAWLRPVGDVERCANARKVVEQMEAIALSALAALTPRPIGEGM